MDEAPSSTTLPRGFRFADHLPRTPEPFAHSDDAPIPSPPRQRFRLKRRNASQFQAPTQQFLASVAAADVPIPSVEEPERTSIDLSMDDSLPQLEEPAFVEGLHLSLKFRGRSIAQPKTPATEIVPSLSPRRYPDWTVDSSISSSIESTPDRESSRPSTSRSTQTSASLWSRLSQLSDFDQCVSPDAAEKDQFINIPTIAVDDLACGQSSRPRKAPWTKAMSAHLWKTYVLYLQDPKVTPFRMGKSCIPPHGVCARVAREAKRSWKGSRNPNTDGARKSGSSTPTAEGCGAFIQWPHTCAATRGHLRELCRMKAASLGVRNLDCISRSPTPFTQAASRHWNRRSTPGRTSAFTTHDMSKTLTLSASDTMQPDGPLAQLAAAPAVTAADTSAAPPTQEPPRHLLGTFENEPSFAERRRLGSPFSAQSYGPSSSASLAAALGLSTPGFHRQTHTIGPRRTLQSPVRLSRSGTQKRKSNQPSEPRKRPSLGSDTWLDPNGAGSPSTSSNNNNNQTDAGHGILFSSTASREHDKLFIPRSPKEPLLASSISMPDVGKHLTPPLLVTAPPPPRLGSPFSGARGSSFSFPNRLRAPGLLDAISARRPFATLQQHQQQLQDPQPSAPARADLASRLAYLDRRLREIHREGRPRSASPNHREVDPNPFGS